MLDETTIHILGGGIGGTVGAIVTCPLELVKVRFQSSQGKKFSGYATELLRRQKFPIEYPEQHDRLTLGSNTHSTTYRDVKQFTESPPPPSSPTSSPIPRKRRVLFRSKILRCISEVVRTEGVGALYKGLFPTLVGVLPSRGIYFSAYHKGQNFFQNFFPEGHSAVFLFSAGFGSLTASTFTCPIWYIKTRLQLDSRPCSSPVTIAEVVRSTWKTLGFRGFYRGISASYVGSLETALNFVIYENVKAQLLQWDRLRRARSSSQSSDYSSSGLDYASNLMGTQGGSKLENSGDMGLCMIASAFSKAIAITLSYPHEVARTRMREDGHKYRSFLGTLRAVFSEDGFYGLYRGLGTHYIRQVPNSCIMIGTYEGVVFLLQSWGFMKKT